MQFFRRKFMLEVLGKNREATFGRVAVDPGDWDLFRQGGSRPK